MLKQKTTMLKPAAKSNKWFHIDAEGQVVGRLATKIADILRGKIHPHYTPHVDSGDYVVITNCEKVVFTSNKWEDKKYYRHSGYVGSLKERTALEQKEKHPELILKLAVKGMLPKGALGKQQLSKLRLFVGPEHTLQAQKPVDIELGKGK